LLANAGLDLIGCSTDFYNLNASAIGGVLTYSFEWIGVQSSQSVQVSTLISTSYTLNVTDANNCINTDILQISIIPCGSLIIDLPNVFTPNGDGDNDSYGIISQNAISQEALIVNRWGEIMIELNTPNQLWDGKIQNGKEALEGVYFIKFRLVGAGGDEKIGHAFFHLVR
jgi:gliding motility-associated-like protein